ncbi:hypothetical protein [Sphingobium fuliginis]|jgi:hypothetical protein|uniref:hypothetical protein n=1 Tax=Sphingobium fuliginis (strain ATCC 27551) TaxID=336203 RepID=UPI0037C95CCB
MLRDDPSGEHLDFLTIGGLRAIARIDDEIVRRRAALADVYPPDIPANFCLLTRFGQRI